MSSRYKRHDHAIRDQDPAIQLQDREVSQKLGNRSIYSQRKLIDRRTSRITRFDQWIGKRGGGGTRRRTDHSIDRFAQVVDPQHRPGAIADEQVAPTDPGRSMSPGTANT